MQQASQSNNRVVIESFQKQAYFEVVSQANASLSLTPIAETILLLLPYMSQGKEKQEAQQALKVDDPVFANNLKTVQDIYTSWNPDFSRVEVELIAPSQGPAQIEPNQASRVGCFFTGGVDSFYTFLKNRDEVTDLIFVYGFDIGLADSELRQLTSTRLREIAKHYGKNLIEIESDFRTFIEQYVEWGEYGHGVALAATAHMLPSEFSKIYIPSSYTYAELFPWGSHPLLDHLWSSSRLSFVHYGCEATRADKVEYISDEAIVLSHLRVCFQNPDSQYNCGRCEKCLRTMINLRACNKLEQATAFAHPLDYKLVSQIFVYDEHGRAFIRQNYNKLKAKNIDPELQAILWKILNKKMWLHNFKQMLPKGFKARLKKLPLLKDLASR